MHARTQKKEKERIYVHNMESWGAHSMHLTFLGSLGILFSVHFHNIRCGIRSNAS